MDETDRFGDQAAVLLAQIEKSISSNPLKAYQVATRLLRWASRLPFGNDADANLARFTLIEEARKSQTEAKLAIVARGGSVPDSHSEQDGTVAILRPKS